MEKNLYLHHHFVPRVVFFLLLLPGSRELFDTMGTRKRRRKNPKFQWPIANKTRKSRRNIDKKRRWKNCRSRRPNLRQQESQSTCHSTSFTRKRNAHLKKKFKKIKRIFTRAICRHSFFVFKLKKKIPSHPQQQQQNNIWLTVNFCLFLLTCLRKKFNV